MAISDAGASCREVVSAAIMGKIEGLANRMEQLNDRVYGKLDPVMMPDLPATCVKETSCSDDVYPPYFDRLRNYCRAIERNINSIEEALRRTEV